MPYTPLVSTVVPTYNRADLLPQTLDSILAQTYANLEAIVVDDQSTDDTQAIMRAYVSKDSRVRYFQNTGNKGVSAARNVALEHCRGELVAFLDSDDLWLPDHVEAAVALFGFEKGAAFYMANRIQFDLVTRLEIGEPFPGKQLLQQVSNQHLKDEYYLLGREFLELLFTGNPMASCSVVIRRQAIGDIRFDEQLKAAVDRDFWLGILLGEDVRVAFRNEVVTKIARHGGNLTGPSPDAQLRLLYAHERIFRKLLNDKRLSEAQKTPLRKQSKLELSLLPYMLRQRGDYWRAMKASWGNSLHTTPWATAIDLFKTGVLWSKSKLVKK